MRKDSPGGTFRVEAGLRRVGPDEPIRERPFHVALLGDFGGRSAQRNKVGNPALEDRLPVQIDRDDLDAVMARIVPSLDLTLPNGVGSVRVEFEELDHFHPDHLVEHPRLFGDLRARRAEIADPDGFARLKENLDEEADQQHGKTVENPDPAPAEGSILDQIIGESTQQQSAALAEGALEEFVRRVVAPHEVPRGDALQNELLARTDEDIAARMRWVLHHREFQALESIWRGAAFLCRRVETSANLKLFLVDISKEELRSDQRAGVPLEETGLYRLLVESTVGTPGATPWSLLVGCYSFGPEMDDLKLLARIGAITSLADASWLSAADSTMVGCPSFGTTTDPRQWDASDLEGWNAIRLLPYANKLGMAMPRFLLRLPYGERINECDLLPFEEFPENEYDHEDYLWGNPALPCALVLVRANAGSASGIPGGSGLEIDKLPLHLRMTNTGTVAQPCAEALLSENAITTITERGLMALASIKDRDEARLVRLQSVSDPPTSLKGPSL